MIPDLEVSLPEGAFYFWPNIERFLGKSFRNQMLKDSGDFCNALLDSQGVATVPGKEFGCEGYLRLSYTLEENRLKEAILRLKNFTQSLI